MKKRRVWVLKAYDDTNECSVIGVFTQKVFAKNAAMNLKHYPVLEIEEHDLDTPTAASHRSQFKLDFNQKWR